MKKIITVSIALSETSQPIIHKSVLNTYTKGPFYCVYVATEEGDYIYKYPSASIWRVREDYGDHQTHP